MEKTQLFRLFLGAAVRKNIGSGKCLHAYIVKSGLWADTFLSNSAINMYAKCGHLPDASAAFDDMLSRDVVSWNSLINSYSHLGAVGAPVVLHLFQRMRTEAVLPNAFTFAGVFTAASNVGDVFRGREVHCVAVKSGRCGDVYVGSSLLSMYSKMGLLSDARKVFDKMPHRNSVSWAAMISGYAAEKKHGMEAFQLFKLMLIREESEVNEFVLTSVLSALCLPEFLDKGRQVHGLVIKNGLASFVPVWNALVTVYAKCECMDDSFSVFDETSGDADKKNSITWSAVITGYSQNGHSDKALELFSKMHLAGAQPNEFTFVGVLNACADRISLHHGKEAHGYLLKLGFELQVYIKSALVHMYAQCGCIDEGRRAFQQLHHHEADVVLWSTIIGGCVQNGEHEEALALYGRMERESISPNDLTLAIVLKACSSLAALEQGKQVHARVLKYGFPLFIPVGSALSTMYAKCGSLEDCRLVFRRIPRKDVVAWNSIIAGFTHNGRGQEALELFDQMKLEGTEPDHVTFVNLLCACSHMGLVEKGWHFFRLMQDEYCLEARVEHYACMVDILSRAGLVESAKEFIASVPIDHGTSLWRILLGACRDRQNFDIGAYAGERLVELGTQDSSAYILLSNIYAARNRWDDVERVRRKMRERGVNKDPGCSWIEFKSGVHVFVSRELLHPQIKEIQEQVRSLTKHMRLEGYHPCLLLHSFPEDSIQEQVTEEEEFQLIESCVS
ncbi:TPR-like protein [Dioscorea alata]|uniref:TPR-like protein n=1 Tax=Dioscorea alata TaxID=55571 RepID=A0ACB7WMY2_DIOAL|nr:TPR-like protein [Dioscorea alata]